MTSHLLRVRAPFTVASLFCRQAACGLFSVHESSIWLLNRVILSMLSYSIFLFFFKKKNDINSSQGQECTCSQNKTTCFSLFHFPDTNTVLICLKRQLETCQNYCNSFYSASIVLMSYVFIHLFSHFISLPASN